MSKLLLSVDLEDVRDWVKNGSTYSERVPTNTRKYLNHFKKCGVKATFFVVGHVARRYPELIGDILENGHELACHGDTHLQLDKLSPDRFRNDLIANLEALKSAGATKVIGFRAPTFSLTQNTAWAHEILLELGFTYSSSVLPSKNPLYGWPDFGKDPCKIKEVFWEIPATLHRIPGLNVPIAGGVYFRVLPFLLTKWAIRQNIKEGRPVITYFHPYDIDSKQERFMHPDLGDRKYLNMLMYINRAKVLSRLENLYEQFESQSYGDYVNYLESDFL